jgi:signal transduction histidine kinase
LPQYLRDLAECLSQDQRNLIAEVDALAGNVESITNIMLMQQARAIASDISQTVAPVELIEDAVHTYVEHHQRHSLQIIREFVEVPPIQADRHKVIQILTNLLVNAEHACEQNPADHRRVTLRLANGGERIRIEVADNGVGIPPENLTRIFSQGFAAHKGGHGFSLHNGALAAKQMGGSLSAESKGPGHGATFTLELPIPPQPRQPAGSNAASPQ